MTKMATSEHRGRLHLEIPKNNEITDTLIPQVVNNLMNETTLINRSISNSSSVIPMESSSPPSKQSTAKLSYAASMQSFPTKEQAIVIESHDGITIKEYVIAIGKLTNPSNIRYVSRISNGRICIFLSSKKCVEDLILTNPKILINNISLEVRPLLTKNKRIILSNVCPVIPNHEIEEKLLKLGVKPTSKITPLRAGLSIPGFSHILSFRRQMYIQNEDFAKLPETIQIEYEGTYYWIYFSTDSPTCFLCKTEGHLAKHCPDNLSEQTDEPSTSSNNAINVCDNPSEFPELTLESQKPTSSISKNAIQQVNPLPNDHPSPSQYSDDSISAGIQPETDSYAHNKSCPNSTIIHLSGSKRPISLASSDATDTISPDNNSPILETSDRIENHKTSHTSKKPKTESKNPTISDMLLPIKQLLEDDPSLFPLSYLQLQSFFENTIGVNDVTAIAINYTHDIEKLATSLQSLYPYFTDKSIKNRSTRIVKKLLKSVNQKGDLINDKTLPDYSSDGASSLTQ